MNRVWRKRVTANDYHLLGSMLSFWMLFFMHVCRCSNLISTTPGSLLPKRFIFAMFWLFSCMLVVSAISKRTRTRACSFCREYCTFRFNFCRNLHEFFMTCVSLCVWFVSRESQRQPFSSRGFTSEDKFRCCLAKGRVHYEDAEFFIFLPSFDVKYVEFYYLNQIYFSQLLSNVA